nr:probable transmembrane GTPase FZO-like, chloroplastic [Tanacetum cinerariifolium]
EEVSLLNDAVLHLSNSDKSSIDEPPEVELKDLPPHLEYAFLDGKDEFPVIIVKDLSIEEKTALITMEEVSLLNDAVLHLSLKLLGKDALNMIYSMWASDKRMEASNDGLELDKSNGFAGFVNLLDREVELVETERSLLREAIDVIQRASPLGEFNSGKSTFINALLGRKYLKDGVVPTTNEITFLRYSELDSDEQQRCERHPDGQYICYIPAPILEHMIIVDTPGTNVILQRQQRLTEEFVPRADLLLFVISADRPLTESEVAFLRYTQQWKKKVVFVLNKSDIYQTPTECLKRPVSLLAETIRLIEADRVCKMPRLLIRDYLLTLFPVSARSALKRKLSTISDTGEEHKEFTGSDSYWETTSFYELEKFLYSFLDRSTSTGTERMKLKLETPIAIAEQLLSASQKIVERDCQQAKKDLISINELISSVKDYAYKMETESISRKKQALSLIDKTQSRVVDLIVSTLRLSNLDIVASYVFRGGNKASMPAAESVRNDVLGPAISESQKLLGEYVAWLQSSNAREVTLYEETFEKRWYSFLDSRSRYMSETRKLVERKNEFSIEVVQDFSAAAASKLFEQEIREVFLGTFGGIGTASLLASLLTSVLPTTLEDLLALGICSAGGYIAFSRLSVVSSRSLCIASSSLRAKLSAVLFTLSTTFCLRTGKFATAIDSPMKISYRDRGWDDRGL